MSSFHFNASEYLVQGGVAGIGVIETIDRFLHERGRKSVIKPWIVADMTEQSQHDVDAVLAAYAEHQLLKAQEMVACEDCGTLAPFEEVREAQAAGDEYPCPGSCDDDLAAQALEVQLVYQLLDTPT